MPHSPWWCGFVIDGAIHSSAAFYEADLPCCARTVIHRGPYKRANTRLYGQRLAEEWDQPVVVDHQHGAGGHIGTDSFCRKQADVYHLLMAASSPMHSRRGFECEVLVRPSMRSLLSWRQHGIGFSDYSLKLIPPLHFEVL